MGKNQWEKCTVVPVIIFVQFAIAMENGDWRGKGARGVKGVIEISVDLGLENGENPRRVQLFFVPFCCPGGRLECLHFYSPNCSTDDCINYRVKKLQREIQEGQLSNDLFLKFYSIYMYKDIYIYILEFYCMYIDILAILLSDLFIGIHFFCIRFFFFKLKYVKNRKRLTRFMLIELIKK